MKRISLFALLVIGLSSCVPIKKYEELQAKEQTCSEELAKFKKDALNYEAQAKSYQSKFEVADAERQALIKDTTELGREYRTFRAKYDRLAAINEALETNYDKLRLSGAKETATLNAELERRELELQKREDELMQLEKALTLREEKIKVQEERLAELNEIIRKQEEATRILKEKVANALKTFENKGLTVEEKDGKIYVSLEAKLLFKSGSTKVEAEGKEALVELAKILAPEKDLEIVVEGHTDSDAMSSSTHPSNNWELSVLRATSVISIMTENSDIDPAQLMAAGRSEYHPVDPEDKAKNRRIEIIISPDLDALYDLISE